MVRSMHDSNLRTRRRTCCKVGDELSKEKLSGMPMKGAAQRKQGYVDCQVSSQSTLYIYRPCAAHPAVEPSRNCPHTNGHFSQYQYPSDLGCVDLYRAQSRGYRGAFDHALRKGSHNTRR